MDCIAQEMEREEGEGVQGRVRPEGEEEGGQGHQEQDDGQGVEVPELQVTSRLSEKYININCSETTLMPRSGSAEMGTDFVETVLTRTMRGDGRTSLRWGRMESSGGTL